MDALTLAEICPDRCIWPCKLGIIANLIIVGAAVKYLVQVLRGFKSKK